MSFLSGLQAVGSWLGGKSVGSQLARTAILAYAVNRMTASVNADNQSSAATESNNPDYGARLQVDPDPEHKIPIVYGMTHLGGIITDAQASNSNQVITYAVTIAEKTGIKLSDSVQSTFTFNDVYMNDQRIVFKADGITVDYTTDRDGNIDYSAQDLIKVYCFVGDSTSPVVPSGYTNNSLQNAYAVMPGWDLTYMMNDLIFALVRVTYNKDKGITNIPNMKFQITNSMTKPGDCLYDYMTNTRYGAGIPSTEINT
jgi:hypothetical protein